MRLRVEQEVLISSAFDAIIYSCFVRVFRVCLHAPLQVLCVGMALLQHVCLFPCMSALSILLHSHNFFSPFHRVFFPIFSSSVIAIFFCLISCVLD